MEKKNENENNNKYKLIGIINLLEADVDFVIPVFENEGIYFTQAKTNPLKIDAFDFLLNSEMIKRIKSIHQYDILSMPNKKVDFVEGDDVLYGFQMNNNELFLGNFNEFKKYFYSKKMNINDRIYVQDSIDEIVNCLRRR